MFETFAHTADLGLRVRAADKEELFRDAAQGLFAMQIVNVDAIRLEEELLIEVRSDEIDYQLFDWLTELLYRFDTEHLLLGEFKVRFDDEGMKAICRGEKLDPVRHQMDHEVKAITYHGLKVEKDDDGWLAEVIVDI